MRLPCNTADPAGTVSASTSASRTSRFRRITLYCVLLMFGIPAVAHAYVDPGAGLLLWQMLAAAFAGFLFYVGKIVSKIRGKGKKSDRDGE